MTGSQWTIEPKLGFDGLKLEESVTVPEPTGSECLVRLEAASLNYRDIAMALGRYPGQFRDRFVPCSDGAGTVVAIGPSVTEFKVGDKVVTSFFQRFEDGLITPEARATSLGSPIDGVLRQYAAFRESGIVLLPNNLSTLEASTLPCAAVTAWNALFGIESRRLKPGQTVLIQGTGGVSLFAAQFGLAVGATVIATTSSDEKEKKLKDLGVHHVINYTSDPNWGDTAKKLSPGGEGAHHIIEVTGDTGLPQSLKAVRTEGVISVVGFLGGAATPDVSAADMLKACCIIRGTHVGSREQLKQLVDFCDEHKIRPVISETFEFGEAQKAFECLKNQQFFGKVVVNFD